MTMRRLLVPAALLALGLVQAFDAAALGLARARGAVLIGRPLNVTIAATAEAGDPDVPCVEADVFMGDTRARRVHVRWEPTTAGAGNVRVLTEGVVDEPVVTIYMRVGCANKVTRRYVMLADEPMDQQEQQQAPAAASVPAQVLATPVAPRPALPAAAAPPLSSPIAGAQVPAVDPIRIQPAPRIAPRTQAPAQSRARSSPPAAPSKSPRLKLDPLDLTAERDPALRATGKLQAEPVADEERRRQAAAMWKALSAGPEEAMRNSERLAALERDVRSLHDLMRKNTAALELMRDQTLKARSERNWITVVALVLGVLVAAAAAAWLWTRARRTEAGSGAWWGGNRRPREVMDSEFASELHPSHPPAGKPATKAATVPPSTPPDIDLGASRPAPLPPQAPRHARPPASKPPRFSASSRFQVSDFQASIPGSSRMMKAEELIDIQQQADFFLSIDQPDRAIALLEAHIQQEQETSALAWMDLLEIYHDLGREEDYDRIREGFHERFNAQVPAMEDYLSEQGGLEHYSRAMSRIVSLWPSRRVLEVIEESLFRKPGTSGSETFDLEAYRELVLLYNIGREVAQDTEEPAGDLPDIPQTNFGKTTAMSLSALQGYQPSQPPAAVEPSQMPWPSENLGLDIDLGDFSSLPPAPVSSPKPKKEADAPPTDLDSLDWRSLR